jgi:NADH-quinone oxidoreductase subunit A
MLKTPQLWGVFSLNKFLCVFLRHLNDLEMNSAANYLPIVLQILFAGGFVAIMILVSSLVGPSRKTSDKLENFASGIE